MRASPPLVAALLVVGCSYEGTVPAPGPVERFDPVAPLAQIAAFAGPQAELLELRAIFVKADGTLDLDADYRPSVRYRFTALASKDDVEAQGPRAPGSGFGPNDRVVVEVDVHRAQMMGGTRGGRRYGYKDRGMSRTVQSKADKDAVKVAPPTCSFADLWRTAKASGAPGDVVAIIRYGLQKWPARGAAPAPAYEFRSNGKDFTLELDAACKPIRK